jgi:DNA-binding MarR family transcriptional regulator
MPTIDELLKMNTVNDPYKRIIVDVIYTGNWLVSNMNDILKPFDITEPQFNVLRILRGQHGKSMNLYEIQNRMVQKMSNVSRLIDKLLEKELVSRTECPENRRRVDIVITDKGHEMLAKVDPLFLTMSSNIAHNLNKEEAMQLAALLDKMRGD